MAAQIIKMYKEHFSTARLIGKRYTDGDRVDGIFAEKWGQWFQNKWFHKILGDSLSVMPDDFGSYLGFMRVIEGEFEYWIGTAFPPDTPVPDGFEYIDLGECDVATYWIYGNEQSGELFDPDVHERCLAQLAENGYTPKENAWCMERYTCPRYTEPDEKGNVILDYCIAIESQE